MNEDFQKYEQLVREEDELLNKIETYQEAISALLMLIHKRGASDLHMLTVEEILTTIHSAENEYRTELLHLRLSKCILSNQISQNVKV